MIPAISFPAELELEGTFQGENLYVKNPFASTGVGFCVYEVTVNGVTTTDEINSSAFEVDFAVFRFTPGDAVRVNIRYKEGCKPSIINPEVIAPRATFKTADISMDNDELSWVTTNEAGSLRFVIEQFRWNKWVKVGEVQGVGTPGKHNYNFTVRLHSGENRFRVKQSDYRRQQQFSPEVTVLSDKPEVILASEKVGDEIIFSAPTLFEIYDSYGRIVFKGYGEKAGMKGLNSGTYYLNYGNKMTRITKR